MGKGKMKYDCMAACTATKVRRRLTSLRRRPPVPVRLKADRGAAPAPARRRYGRPSAMGRAPWFGYAQARPGSSADGDHAIPGRCK